MNLPSRTNTVNSFGLDCAAICRFILHTWADLTQVMVITKASDKMVIALVRTGTVPTNIVNFHGSIQDVKLTTANRQVSKLDMHALKMKLYDSQWGQRPSRRRVHVTAGSVLYRENLSMTILKLESYMCQLLVYQTERCRRTILTHGTNALVRNTNNTNGVVRPHIARTRRVENPRT